MMTYTQLELPGMPPERPKEPRIAEKGRKRWCYLVNRRTQEMYALSDTGEPIWIPHDTVRETPHLFATLRLALNAAVKFEGVAVYQYPWEV